MIDSNVDVVFDNQQALETGIEFVPIYHRRINKRLCVAVGLLCNINSQEYSQFLMLSLQPDDPSVLHNDARVCLSTWRKINKWLDKLNLLEARHLTNKEKRIVDRYVKLRQHSQNSQSERLQKERDGHGR